MFSSTIHHQCSLPLLNNRFFFHKKCVFLLKKKTTGHGSNKLKERIRLREFFSDCNFFFRMPGTDIVRLRFVIEFHQFRGPPLFSSGEQHWIFHYRSNSWIFDSWHIFCKPRCTLSFPHLPGNQYHIFNCIKAIWLNRYLDDTLDHF